MYAQKMSRRNYKKVSKKYIFSRERRRIDKVKRYGMMRETILPRRYAI
jgi:hypothetical protein